MFVLDTNTIIYYIGGDERAVSFIESQINNQADFVMPTVCIVEFLSYPGVSEAEKESFLALVKKFEIQDLDYNNALVAAEFRTRYKLKVVDSVIAAAAQTLGAVLVSRDRDFRKVREIEVLEI